MIKLIFFIYSLVALGSETYYVQSTKTSLRSLPKSSSELLLTLPRGTELEVLSKEGLWYKVSAQGKTGWTCRLFIAPHKPVGKAELENIPEELEKMSRRRTSSYTVTAATRGGFESARIRGSRELYKSNFIELEKIEDFRLPEDKLCEFWTSANLTIK